ncbi:MAG: serine/threonine-protein phosphatase [Novosphingobium sp.]|nr:serine/threonine-protein phosphatase [Novosphingobium sp.]
MRAGFRIEDASLTHVGVVRSENEDSHVSLPQAGIWVVADGMGGAHDGRFAAQTIADSVAAVEPADDLELACERVAAAIHAANARIFARSRELGKQMGSTVVALIVHGGEFVVMWAGDSRAYLYRDGALIPLTRDHTMVEGMVERGLLTTAEAADHPMRHILARAVGVQETLEVDAIRDTIVTKDLFLLCSDGLHGVLADDEIAAILGEDRHAAGDKLVSACLERGAPDNVTVTLVAASEPTLLALSGTAP